MIKSWQPARILLLAMTLSGTLLVLGKAISPATQPSFDQTRRLPATVPLEKWQLLTTRSIPPVAGLPIGQQYQYRQNATLLDVQMRYVLGDGDVSRFLFMYTPIQAANANLKIKHQPGVGFYGVLSHQGRAYLSACINPRGDSTVTEQQFTQNRYAYDLKASRLLSWVAGQEPLLDRRCLWTLISLPLPTSEAGAPSSAASEQAYQTLETVWFSWYRWWHNAAPI